jgi:hypothetical protein
MRTITMEIDRFQPPGQIFHAAAYKHVPMMETNRFQAVRNNVFGTYNAALVAKQYGIEDFVMISSDKAVRPWIGSRRSSVTRVARTMTSKRRIQPDGEWWSRNLCMT